MIRPSQALRLAHINFVLTRHGLAEIILATHLFRPLRFLIYFLPSYWLRGVHGPRGVRIRRALESLGPMFVKFGQLLSTRRDLLPEAEREMFIVFQNHIIKLIALMIF